MAEERRRSGGAEAEERRRSGGAAEERSGGVGKGDAYECPINLHSFFDVSHGREEERRRNGG